MRRSSLDVIRDTLSVIKESPRISKAKMQLDIAGRRFYEILRDLECAGFVEVQSFDGGAKKYCSLTEDGERFLSMLQRLRRKS